MEDEELVWDGPFGGGWAEMRAREDRRGLTARGIAIAAEALQTAY
jgi:hypothetical protein